MLRPRDLSAVWTVVSFSILRFIHGANIDVTMISPVIRNQSSLRSLHNRKAPDFGGRQGLASAPDLSKHKNRVKTIGVQFFTEDAPAVFKQDKAWQEIYGFDESVGYHWFGKSTIGLGSMNMLVKEYNRNNQNTTVIVG